MEARCSFVVVLAFDGGYVLTTRFLYGENTISLRTEHVGLHLEIVILKRRRCDRVLVGDLSCIA